MWKPIATIGNRGWFQLISWCVRVAITTLWNRESDLYALDHHHPDGAFAGRITEAVESEPRTLPAPAGSAIFLHGLTPHSSLPNRSGADRRTLILAYRAGDAYPLYYGLVTAEDEAVRRPVRGRRARHARFGGPAPIVPEIDGTSSLYEIQAGRPGAPRPRSRH